MERTTKLLESLVLMFNFQLIGEVYGVQIINVVVIFYQGQEVVDVLHIDRLFAFTINHSKNELLDVVFITHAEIHESNQPLIEVHLVSEPFGGEFENMI